MNDTKAELTRLLAPLLGITATVEGKELTVVEILPELPALVLQEQAHSKSHFQENQYGETGRKVQKTFTVNLWNEQGTDVHPVVRSLVSGHTLTELAKLLPPAPKNQ